MSTEGSLPRTTLPIGLACLAVWVGWLAMHPASQIGAAIGPRAVTLIGEVCLAAPTLLALIPFGVPLRQGLALFRIPQRTAFLTLVAGAALWICAIGLVTVQQAVWAPPPGHIESFEAYLRALRPDGPFEALLSFATIAWIPAICEEAVFRGVVLPAFLTRMRPVLAVVLSALLFGAVHVAWPADGVGALYQVPQAVVVGLVLGALRVRSGSLLPGVLAHALYNATTLSLSLAATAEATEPGPPQPGLGLAFMLVGAAVAVLAVRRLPAPPSEPPSLLDSIP
jgi:membrane protease YdiL (CAAX protease family)